MKVTDEMVERGVVAFRCAQRAGNSIRETVFAVLISGIELIPADKGYAHRRFDDPPTEQSDGNSFHRRKGD